MLTLLAAASEPASTSGLVLVFYIVTIAAACAGMIFGVARLSSTRRKDQAEETAKSLEQATAMAANTAAAAANTAAVQRLSEKLDRFGEELRREQLVLSGQVHEHENRIARLER